MSRFVLCADDYAQCAAVDAGILHLLQQQRLTAVSCLVESPRWPAAAVALQALSNQADIGLHLNFTHSFSSSSEMRPWSLSALIAMAYLHLLPATEVETRIARQIELFKRHMGRLPDYIDGHHHVHQLPQIRNILLQQIAHYWGQRKPWVRVALPRRFRGVKAFFIGALGGRVFHRLLLEEGIPANCDFAGIYSLRRDANYRGLMQSWLEELAPGGVIMCHPGTESDAEIEAVSDVLAGDPIRAARARELSYLGSRFFITDCHNANRQLGRFKNSRA